MAEVEVNWKRILPFGIVVISLIFIIIFWARMMITIDAGHAGVMFRLLGGGVDTTRTYNEGFHMISPLNSMIVYETRQQETAEEMNVLSSNGLEISVDVSAWYKPEYDKIGLLHSKIGKNYLSRIIIPALRSSARSVIGRYTPEQIYSSKRDVIQDEIFEEAKIILTGKITGIDVT